MFNFYVTQDKDLEIAYFMTFLVCNLKSTLPLLPLLLVTLV